MYLVLPVEHHNCFYDVIILELDHLLIQVICRPRHIENTVSQIKLFSARKIEWCHLPTISILKFGVGKMRCEIPSLWISTNIHNKHNSFVHDVILGQYCRPSSFNKCYRNLSWSVGGSRTITTSPPYIPYTCTDGVFVWGEK